MIKVLRWSLSLALLPLIVCCNGYSGSSSQKVFSGQLTVDESLLPEQQMELYKLQTDAFADSITQFGFSVLGKTCDSSFYVFYAKDTIYYHTHNWGSSIYTWIPSILCMDIKNGKIKKVSFPNTIDGHALKINIILDYYSKDGNILMIVSNKKTDELEYYMSEPVDVIYFNGKNFSFNYIVGGHPWAIDRNDETICRYDDIFTIPFSQIFDGTYKNDLVFLEAEQDSVEISELSE